MIGHDRGTTACVCIVCCCRCCVVDDRCVCPHTFFVVRLSCMHSHIYKNYDVVFHVGRCTCGGVCVCFSCVRVYRVPSRWYFLALFHYFSRVCWCDKVLALQANGILYFICFFFRILYTKCGCLLCHRNVGDKRERKSDTPIWLNAQWLFSCVFRLKNKSEKIFKSRKIVRNVVETFVSRIFFSFFIFIFGFGRHVSVLVK